MYNDDNFTYVFATSDLDYIANILRSVYSIRTAKGEEDELLGDFIEALDNCDCICAENDEEVEEEELPSFFV